MPPRCITEVMKKDVCVVQVGDTAEEALQLAHRLEVHYLLVVDEEAAIGVTCLCDIERAKATSHVGEFMHSPFVFVCTSWSVERTAELMRHVRVGFLPVLDDEGRIEGVVTRGDLRRLGLLSDEPGVTRCASCGASHDLRASYPGGVVFCRSCMEQVNPSLDDTYFTLGGEG